MSALAIAAPHSSAPADFDLLDRLADLRQRRAAKKIDDHTYLDELHLMLLWHRM
jgi:hypothetical protein